MPLVIANLRFASLASCQNYNREPELKLLREMKQKISTEDLCDGLPNGFAVYFDHVCSLQFGDKPRYSYLRRTL